MKLTVLIPLILGLLCVEARAEPVDVRQGGEVGSGYTFGRGDTCTVLTAGHVVAEAGDEVSVVDRTGGKAIGQRVYFNEAYDLALVELPRGSVVACNARWPETQWMGNWQPDMQMPFDVVRHYPGGRELLVALRYAGGSNDTLSLAFVDRLRIIASDSGSLARLNGKPVGIVRRVLPDIDRVDVLRFDLIDRLVGERFRGTARGLPIAVTGVTRNNRPNANWQTFVKAWLTERAGRRVVDAKDPSALCGMGINVIEWKRTRLENPEYSALNAELAKCGNSVLNLFGDKARKLAVDTKRSCELRVRDQLRKTPRYLKGHALMFDMSVTPRSGAPISRLKSVEIMESSDASGTAEIERGVLQAAIAPTALELLQAGACE